MPIDEEVMGSFDGIFQTQHLVGIDLVRNDFRDAVEDLLPYAVWGKVISAKDGHELAYSTVQIPASECIYRYRGRRTKHIHVQHKACPGCGNIFPSANTKEAFVRKVIGRREMWTSRTGGTFHALERVIEDRKLLLRFPDIRLHRIPILEEPQDGWTLPGDPGWDGTLLPPFVT